VCQVAKRLLKAVSQVGPVLDIAVDALVDVDLRQVSEIESLSHFLRNAFDLSYLVVHEENEALEPRNPLLHLLRIAGDGSSLSRFLRIYASNFCQTAVSTRRFETIALGDKAISSHLSAYTNSSQARIFEQRLGCNSSPCVFLADICRKLIPRVSQIFRPISGVRTNRSLGFAIG
jgi:hypothetical protein